MERLPEGDVRVAIYEYKDEEPGRLYYERLFYKGETKNIQLFGLREEDRFEVFGESNNKSIKIRLVPGPEDDIVLTSDQAKAFRKRTRVYAWPGEDSLQLSSETQKHLTRYTRFNRFDNRAVNFDYGIFLPTAGFNVDDGVILGLSYQRHHYTYHRQFVQKLTGTFATASLGSRLEYDFKVIDVAPRLDFGVLAAYQTPSFAVNYFGLGNETQEIPRNELPNGRSFYRIRQELFGLYPNLRFRHKNHDGGFRVSIGAESIQLERDPERLLAIFDEDNPIFDQHTYAGAGIGYSFRNVDNPRYPSNGLVFDADFAYRRRFDPEATNITMSSASLTLYQHLWKGAVLAGRVGGGLSTGDWYFYNGQTLGAGRLRGFRRERFVGDQAFFLNFDYRQELLKVLYSRMGIFLSYDRGRVWLEEESSDIWHSGYGGGVFIRPLSLFGLSVGYYIPEDDSPAVVRVVAGFDF